MISRLTIDAKAREIADDCRTLARNALAAGGQEVSRARYYEGGPVVITVSLPESWRAGMGQAFGSGLVHYTER